jgi:hypothetical protein
LSFWNPLYRVCCLCPWFQVINRSNRKPALVVILYAAYVQKRREEINVIPQGVVSRPVDVALPVRAWRKHFNLTQTDAPAPLGIRQPACSEQESGPSRSNRRTSEHGPIRFIDQRPAKTESSARSGVSKPMRPRCRQSNTSPIRRNP